MIQRRCPHDKLHTLDRWQAIALYLPDTDKHGSVIGTVNGPVRLSAQAEFERYWRSFDLPDYRIQQLWHAQQEYAAEVQRQAKERQREITYKKDKQRRNSRGRPRS